MKIKAPLISGFKYAANGKSKTAKSITLNPPGFRQASLVSAIKPFMNDAEAKAEPIGCARRSKVTYNGTAGDDFHKAMISLMSSGICRIDNSIPLSANHIAAMDKKDFERICGVYIGEFIASR